METLQRDRHAEIQDSWEEKSGLIHFLSQIHAEVSQFESTFGFGVTHLAAPPTEIDGSGTTPGRVGFVVIRQNRLITERTYCLYSVLNHRVLAGYLGTYSGGKIQTLRQLKPVQDFGRALPILREWLRDLIRASCEKL